MRLPLALSLLAVVACGAPAPPPAPPKPVAYTWRKLETVPYKGKQDDIFFPSPNVGYYGNGLGQIWKTVDAGASWSKAFEKPGTYFRTIAFLDDQRGFAGNIGTDYFPGVTDTTPLYTTRDGGTSWTAAMIAGDPIKGLCALDILRVPFINAGVLAYRTVIHAAGRVGGPSALAVSNDEGATWSARPVENAGMILDVKFLDAKVGFLCAATSPEVEESHALILKTTDGGATWQPRYRGTRPFENTWKCSFPSRKVGYATVQSYDPDTTKTKRIVIKTTDEGETWSELPLVDDFAVREFGIGFLDERVGWVGAMPHGFETQDGGASWKPVDFGKAVNKIRIVPGVAPARPAVYAIGSDVYKLAL